MKESLTRLVSALVCALSTLYVVVLFFDWQHVDVGFGSVTTTASGWGGWGIVAGVVALGLIVYALLEVGGYIPPDPGTEIPPVAMAVVLLLTTVARFQTIADLNVAGAVVVDRRWPATAGLVLAAVLAALALVQLVLRAPAFRRRTGQPLSASR
jgi:hypothetical protein